MSDGCRNCYAEVMARRNVLMARGRGERSSYEDVVAVCKGCGGSGRTQGDGEMPCDACNGTGTRPQWNGRAVFLPERLDQPLRWRKPRRVFVNSMSDLFHEDLKFEEIAAVFGIMAAAPKHTFQVLTKRPSRALEFFKWLLSPSRMPEFYDRRATVDPLAVLNHCMCIEPAAAALDRWLDDEWGMDLQHAEWPLPNVWLGVSAEDQATADERIPMLLQCPAAVRFVSAEPLLGPIDLCPWNIEAQCDEPWLFRHPIPTGEGYVERHAENRRCGDCANRIDWIIVGGESGPGARPCDVGWIRSIVEQCGEAGVPVFVKQLGTKPRRHSSSVHADTELRLKDRKGGDPDEWPEDLRVRQFPGAS